MQSNGAVGTALRLLWLTNMSENENFKTSGISELIFSGYGGNRYIIAKKAGTEQGGFWD